EADRRRRRHRRRDHGVRHRPRAGRARPDRRGRPREGCHRPRRNGGRGRRHPPAVLDRDQRPPGDVQRPRLGDLRRALRGRDRTPPAGLPLPADRPGRGPRLRGQPGAPAAARRPGPLGHPGGDRRAEPGGPPGRRGRRHLLPRGRLVRHLRRDGRLRPGGTAAGRPLRGGDAGRGDRRRGRSGGRGADAGGRDRDAAGDRLRRPLHAAGRGDGRGGPAGRPLPPDELHHGTLRRLASEPADDHRVLPRALLPPGEPGVPVRDGQPRRTQLLREDGRRGVDAGHRRGVGRAGARLRGGERAARLGRLLRGHPGRQPAPGVGRRAGRAGGGGWLLRPRLHAGAGHRRLPRRADPRRRGDDGRHRPLPPLPLRRRGASAGAQRDL
ncbi:MAG: putative sarcosine oxidase subunit beta, partial [uncultured Thermomicrobiales bacterium]